LIIQHLCGALKVWWCIFKGVAWMSVKRNGITVNVSPDKMYAFLSLQPQENVKVMPEDIYLLLEEEGITHGIDVEAIKSLCSTSGRIQKQ
jgi:uncharacterized protein (DUF342 family)